MTVTGSARPGVRSIQPDPLATIRRHRIGPMEPDVTGGQSIAEGRGGISIYVRINKQITWINGAISYKSIVNIRIAGRITPGTAPSRISHGTSEV